MRGKGDGLCGLSCLFASDTFKGREFGAALPSWRKTQRFLNI